MGAFLAALGAVLLFILRVIGILLLVVLILLVLLLLCPFCADLCWEHGVLTVKAGALGITFPVFQYPKPEPPPAPENPEPPRGFGKVKARFAAWRAERKRKKAEEKARKKAAAAAAKANKPAQPRKKAKITLEILCTMLKGAGTLTKAVFGALRITKIQVRLGVRGEDPAAAAPTASPCFRHWRRSSPLQPAGCSKSHFHTRGRNKKQHLSASGQFSKKPQYFLKKGLLFAR